MNTTDDMGKINFATIIPTSLHLNKINKMAATAPTFSDPHTHRVFLLLFFPLFHNLAVVQPHSFSASHCNLSSGVLQVALYTSLLSGLTLSAACPHHRHDLLFSYFLTAAPHQLAFSPPQADNCSLIWDK